MSFNYFLQTRYAETAQDKIIHHSSFVTYLEVARCAFFHKIGYDIKEIEKKQIFCPTVDLFIKYQKPLYSLEEIQITISTENLTKVRFSLNYSLFRNIACIAQAKTTHCFVNSSFKPLPLPKKMIESLKKAL